MQNSSPCYCDSRAQKTAVVAVVAINGDQLGQLAVERSAVSQEPDFEAVVGKDSNDHRARLAVSLEEAAAAIVVVRLFIGTQKQISGPPLCPSS